MKVTSFSAIALVVALSACGGGGGDGSSGSGSSLPPDPGAAGVSTVGGVDTNANGVRDDVEIQLHARYERDPAALAAATESARLMQRVLSISPSDSAAVESQFTSSIQATVCIYQQLGQDSAKAGEIMTRVHVMTFNTPARVAQLKAVSAAIGTRAVKVPRTC